MNQTPLTETADRLMGIVLATELRLLLNALAMLAGEPARRDDEIDALYQDQRGGEG